MSMQIEESCGDVFKDLGFSEAQSERLRIKSALMVAVEAYISSNKLTQEEAANIMGVSRPRVSDAVRGRVDKFTIDALVDMLSKAGFHVDISIGKAA